MFKMKTIGIRYLLRLAALLLVFCVTTVEAFAAGSGRLTLNYRYGNVTFRIYRAADAGGKWTDAFRDCQIDVGNLSSNREWEEASQRLAAYVADHKIDPNNAKTTSGGSVSFSALADGVYLVTGEASRDAGYLNTPVPFLVKIADSSAVTANVKYDRSKTETPNKPKPSTPDKPGTNKPRPSSKPDKSNTKTISKTVRKVWNKVNPKTVRTGDTTPIGLLTVLFGASALIIAWLLVKRKRNR